MRDDDPANVRFVAYGLLALALVIVLMVGVQIGKAVQP